MTDLQFFKQPGIRVSEDYATEDRTSRLWRQQHPILLWTFWIVATLLCLGAWTVAIRFLLWLHG